MEYKVNIKVVIKNEKFEGDLVFEDEQLEMYRSSKLSITNAKESESEFIRCLMDWDEEDRSDGLKTYLNITTEPSSMFDGDKDYYIESMKEEKQKVIFNWINNH
ncbi:hypothetical protein ACIQYL_10025 [Lysinibacillus xylanilyticus]|uniref:hypothetical protein n=1 Tax=Lysinibacillus xylanilyticus TaxID=582475 RepID=UPI0038089D9E